MAEPLGPVAPKQRWLARAFMAGACLAFSAPLFAHEDNVTQGGFFAGLTHPVFGLDHLLAMVAVGIWGAVLGRPLLYLLPVIFPVMMTVGAIVGMGDFPIDFAELAIGLSVLTLGALIALRASLPAWAASSIVGAFALFHGYAHGRELPLAADPVAYSAGFVLATGVLHLVGVGLGWAAGRSRNERLTLRLAGGAIVAAGAIFVYRTLAG